MFAKSGSGIDSSRHHWAPPRNYVPIHVEQQEVGEAYCPRYQDVNDAMYEWYHLAREQLVPVSGPMLQSQALLLAKELANYSFKASNGWLQSFKQRHNIVQLIVSREAGDVCEETVEA